MSKRIETMIARGLSTEDAIKALAIVWKVAKESGVETEAMLAVNARGQLAFKTKNITRARMMIFWLLKTTFDWSYPQVAKVFGANHTTILAAVRKVNKDPELLAAAEKVAANMKLELPRLITETQQLLPHHAVAG